MLTRCPGPDFIDINMGCPVPKVANSGDGSGLMRNPDLAVKVMEAVVRGAGCPVTVKFRLGWDKGSINCVEFARAMEEAGAAARWPSTAAPRCRCTPAPPTGTGFGR